MNIFKNLFKFRKMSLENKKNFYQEVDQFREIGKLLKEARIEQNLSIEELARISKIPKLTINSLENNTKSFRPKYPFIRSILIKLEECLDLERNTLLKLVIMEKKILKKKGNDFIFSKYDLVNTWQGSVLYFLILISTVFILKRYFISNVDFIDVQNIENKINEKNF